MEVIANHRKQAMEVIANHNNPCSAYASLTDDDEWGRLMKSHVPNLHMQSAILRYVALGVEPGGFLCSVIDNDLFKAVKRADGTNLYKLGSYVKFFEYASPAECFGSKTLRIEWQKSGGLAC